MTTAAHNVGRDRDVSQLGMLIALGSWTILFTTLFFGYIVLRVQAAGWYYPRLNELPFRYAFINTLIILTASFSYDRGVRAAKSRSMEGLRNQLVITLGLGVFFLLMQMTLWTILTKDGLTVRSSTAGSLIYLLTGFHAVHIVGGLTALSWVLFQVFKGKVTVDQYLSVDLVGYFWHFLAAVWVIMFITIFVFR